MNKSKKMLTLLVALVSCILIVAGVLMYAFLGFNDSLDLPAEYTVEVKYDVVVEINEQEDALQKTCEDAFAKNGVSYARKEVAPCVSVSSLAETFDWTLVYTFSDGASFEALEKAVSEVKAATASFGTAKIDVSAHRNVQTSEKEWAWRGAVAVAVGAIVALAYLCIRYGVGCGAAGAVAFAVDALLTAALFAVFRIPVYAFAPLLYAAAAGLVSLLYWTFFCMRLKADGKKAENGDLDCTELVEKTRGEMKTPLVYAACALAVVVAVVAVLGAVNAFGTLFVTLPFLLSVFLPLASSLVTAPFVCAKIRKAFADRKAKKKVGYVGKKKAEPTK